MSTLSVLKRNGIHCRRRQKDARGMAYSVGLRLYLRLELHGPSMFAVKAKIYGVLYKQSSSIAFDETSSY